MSRLRRQAGARGTTLHFFFRAQWPRLRWPLVGILGVGLVLVLLWALVTVPALLLGVDQVQQVRQIQDPAKRLDEVNGLRTTLAGVLGGLAVAAGAVVAALNFRETGRQNRAVLELQRRGQVTERFTKAIEQLGQGGAEKLDVRIGAVYALEQIARDSAELHWPIIEILTAFVRVHARRLADRDQSRWGDETGYKPSAEILAIMGVLKRRDPVLDLGRIELPYTDLREVDLDGVQLSDADLRGVSFRGASLASANLSGATLWYAGLGAADLENAKFVGADLRHVQMNDGTMLLRTDFSNAFIVELYLDGASLDGAILTGAHVSGVQNQPPDTSDESGLDNGDRAPGDS